jgi:hypothetical protein
MDDANNSCDYISGLTITLLCITGSPIVSAEETTSTMSLGSSSSTISSESTTSAASTSTLSSSPSPTHTGSSTRSPTTMFDIVNPTSSGPTAKATATCPRVPSELTKAMKARIVIAAGFAGFALIEVMVCYMVRCCRRGQMANHVGPIEKDGIDTIVPDVPVKDPNNFRTLNLCPDGSDTTLCPPSTTASRTTASSKTFGYETPYHMYKSCGHQASLGRILR